MFKNFGKWFDLNLGWFFVNGMKRDEWVEYLEWKYTIDLEKRKEDK